MKADSRQFVLEPHLSVQHSRMTLQAAAKKR